MSPPVLVSVVTYNSAETLKLCLDSVFRQSVEVRLRLFDNASTDESVHIAEALGVEVTLSTENLGFSEGHNRNLDGQRFSYALLLNPDVVLEPDYLEALLKVMKLERVGLAGGKLIRMDPTGKPLSIDGHPVIDSAGMYFTPWFRHLDRGSGIPDRGQYDSREEVFGITGAALIVSRDLFDDLLVEGEFLDTDFFAYREDADLAWRARLRGWRAVYEPRARALHLRCVLPERRRSLAPQINYHSVKNRFLLRRKNADAAVRRRCFPFMWLRDAGILCYALLFERTSLPAMLEAWRLRKQMNRKRRTIQARRVASGPELAAWFSFAPRALKIIESDRDDP